MTISGGRPRQNDSRLDGISVNDYVNGPPGSALGVNLGSDAVEQFTRAVEQLPSAIRGALRGASLALRHAQEPRISTEMHLEYTRNSAFDARNFFDTAKPAFHRNQFGGFHRRTRSERWHFLLR